MKTKKTKLSQLSIKLLVAGLTLLGLNSCVSKKVAQQMQNTIEQKDAQINSMEAEINDLRQTVAVQDAKIKDLSKQVEMGRQKLLYGGPNRQFRKIEE